jgi:hypothetical protein
LGGVLGGVMVGGDAQGRIVGEVAEWLKAHAWKACGSERASWVRIPPSPLRNLGRVCPVQSVVLESSGQSNAGP